jgi:hypothetical protein
MVMIPFFSGSEEIVKTVSADNLRMEIRIKSG